MIVATKRSASTRGANVWLRSLPLWIDVASTPAHPGAVPDRYGPVAHPRPSPSDARRGPRRPPDPRGQAAADLTSRASAARLVDVKARSERTGDAVATVAARTRWGGGGDPARVCRSLRFSSSHRSMASGSKRTSRPTLMNGIRRSWMSRRTWRVLIDSRAAKAGLSRRLASGFIAFLRRWWYGSDEGAAHLPRVCHAAGGRSRLLVTYIRPRELAERDNKIEKPANPCSPRSPSPSAA